MKKQIIVPDSCEGCGQCCDFPSGNKCKDLSCNKTCSIYEARPQVCKDFVRGSVSCLTALRLNRF